MTRDHRIQGPHSHCAVFCLFVFVHRDKILIGLLSQAWVGGED